MGATDSRQGLVVMAADYTQAPAVVNAGSGDDRPLQLIK
jgi:hypothetical protein